MGGVVSGIEKAGKSILSQGDEILFGKDPEVFQQDVLTEEQKKKLKEQLALISGKDFTRGGVKLGEVSPTESAQLREQTPTSSATSQGSQAQSVLSSQLSPSQAAQIQELIQTQGAVVGSRGNIQAPTTQSANVQKQLSQDQVEAQSASAKSSQAQSASPISARQIGLSELESLGVQQRGQAQSTAQESLSQRQQAESSINTALQTITPEAREEFFQQTIAEPIVEQSQDAIRQIGRQSSGSFFGSDRQIQDQFVQEQLIDALARERARFQLESRAQDQKVALEAGQQFAGIGATTGQVSASATQAEISALGQRGGLEESNQQAKLQADASNQQVQQQTNITNASLDSETARLNAQLEQSALQNAQNINQQRFSQNQEITQQANLTQAQLDQQQRQADADRELSVNELSSKLDQESNLANAQFKQEAFQSNANRLLDIASRNAQFKQEAFNRTYETATQLELERVRTEKEINILNSQLAQSNNQFNASLDQESRQSDADRRLQLEQINAQLRQQTEQFNKNIEFELLTKQAQLDENRLKDNQNAALSHQQLINSLIFGQAIENIAVPGTEGIAGDLIGAGGSIGAALLSDRRAKKNIKMIDHLSDGTPVYEFEYLDNDAVYIGVMAQDIEHKYPEAIVHREDGLMSVDYGILNLSIANKK